MSESIKEKSWENKYFELKAYHERERKWMRQLIAKLELELEECKMGIKDTSKTLPKVDHDKVAKGLGATRVSKEAARAEARRRFQKICDSIPDLPTSVLAQSHPYIDTTSQSDEYFVQTLNDIQEYIGISDKDLADDIRISLPSLKRWKNGQNLPHRLARKSIFQYLDKKAFEAYLDKDED